MTRVEMMDKMINTFGFENKWTIWFCEIAEDDFNSIHSVAIAFILAQLNAEQDMKEEE